MWNHNDSGLLLRIDAYGIAPLCVLPVLLPAALAAQTTFRVIDDQGKGVPSIVLKIDARNNSTDLGPTDRDGTKQLSDACQSGDKIKAVPEDSETYHFRLEYCTRIGRELKVSKKSYIENLKKNVRVLEEGGEHGKAALVYNELAARADGFDPDYAREAQEQALQLLARHLNVESGLTFDPAQGRQVMTKEFQDAIKDFQRTNGIEETGAADYRTVERAAETPISKYLFREIQSRPQ